MLTYTIFYRRKGAKLTELRELQKASFSDLQLATDTLSNLKFVGAIIVQTLNFN